MVALNQEEIGKHLQRISKIKPFINKHNWKGINQPSKKNYWKKFKKNNPTFALNVLYAKKMNIYPTYILKQFNQIILLMTPFKDRIIFSKKFISIIKRNNVKRQWWFFLFELSSFLQNKKTNLNHIKQYAKIKILFNQYQKSY